MAVGAFCYTVKVQMIGICTGQLFELCSLYTALCTPIYYHYKHPNATCFVLLTPRGQQRRSHELLLLFLAVSAGPHHGAA